MYLQTWAKKKLNEMMGTEPAGSPTSVTQTEAIQHPGAARRPRGQDTFVSGSGGLERAVGRMGYVVSEAQAGLTEGLIRTLALLAANQKRIEETMAFRKKKNQEKKGAEQL